MSEVSTNVCTFKMLDQNAISPSFVRVRMSKVCATHNLRKYVDAFLMGYR